MDRVNLIVPTRGRPQKLARMMSSLYPAPKWLRVLVAVDGDLDGFCKDYLGAGKSPACVPFEWMGSEEHIGAVATRNKAIATLPRECGGVLYGTDDITFATGAIEAAREDFNKAFSDDDGVLGLKQNGTHHPAGVALVGERFLNRYPNRMLFYPGYWHFACQEIHWLAYKLGRFVCSRRELIKHFHPGTTPGESDTTHVEARRRKAQDHALMNERKQVGKVWGLKQ